MRDHPGLVHAGPWRPGAGAAAPAARALARRRRAAHLLGAPTTREAQLKALPAATTPVAVAHRESVQRILAAIRAAQAELAAGTYGSCHRCGGRADLDLALSRPWSPLCGPCALR